MKTKVRRGGTLSCNFSFDSNFILLVSEGELCLALFFAREKKMCGLWPGGDAR